MNRSILSLLFVIASTSVAAIGCAAERSPIIARACENVIPSLVVVNEANVSFGGALSLPTLYSFDGATEC